MQNEYSPVGKHVVFDLFGIKSNVLNDVAYLKLIYKIAIEKCGAEIRKYQEEIFDPEGVTFTYILSESHASCHTYPDIDKDLATGILMGCIHTCGSVDPDIAVDYLVKVLCPTKVNRHVLIRGVE